MKWVSRKSQHYIQYLSQGGPRVVRVSLHDLTAGRHCVIDTTENNRDNSRNNQHNAQICTTALFIYAGSYMFRQ
jgi:hypothetical protein